MKTTVPSIPLPPLFEKGRYVARFASTDADFRAAATLRHLCFVDGAGRAPLQDGLETDAFDQICDHVLIEVGGQLACCFRVLPLASGAQIDTSYSAQFYELGALKACDFAMVELGRFCTHPSMQESGVLRVAWGMLAAYVDAHQAGLLFGCSSFAGMAAAPYRAAFDLLAARYTAPANWTVGRKASEIVPFVEDAKPVSDQRTALEQVPPLLRSYLTIGGWVSDHAAVDPHMNTLHVFTGLEINKIPAARAKALRAMVP